ncbi:MAG: hypothetical protein KF871_03865 [Hydrogenophaga sp.]|uniref:ADP-ribosyltransferase domain-containing protein n=1 Tax=Hydrogenophaga sp. TaxID=1904254 RepID=UPI001D8DF042|nr:ADP-ribosyltransferase domain-containing protein [Hydrogenophaga sp.]MBX3609009.1 hypothetical protein [Hydrogenophaga sp.]
MTPFTVAQNKLERLQSQLLSHDPGMQVSMSDGLLVVRDPQRSDRQVDEQELRTYLRALSSELAACLDDFLLVSNARGPMDLMAGLGDGPVTVDKLSRALDVAHFRLGQTAHRRAVHPPTDDSKVLVNESAPEKIEAKAVGTEAIDSVKTLKSEVESAWELKKKGLGLFDSHEVLSAPSSEWALRTLKVKAVPRVAATASQGRVAKRKALQAMLANVADLVGHEVLANKARRNHPMHMGLVDALQAFAKLGHDGKPVSPAKFILAAQEVLEQAGRPTDPRTLRIAAEGAGPDSVGGYQKVQVTHLYRVLFETECDEPPPAHHAFIALMKRLLPDLKGLFRRRLVQEAIKTWGLTPEEVLAVWVYSSEYEALNRSCRTGEFVVGAKETIDQLVLALPKLREPITKELYRGVGLKNMPTSVIRQLTTIGSVFADPAPMSTSYDPERAYRDDLRIFIRPCESSRGSSIVPLAHFVGESEILFPPYTRFLVVDARKNANDQWESVTLVELPDK